MADGSFLSDGHVEPRAESTWFRKLGRRLAPLVARKFPRRFGMFEVAALGSAEWLRRHLAIINELEEFRRLSSRASLEVLDFGGADGSLGRAIRMYGLERHYRITTADIEAPATGIASAPPNAAFVMLDPDGALPMDGGSFDVSVSSDVFEHIPYSARSRWAQELRRVSRLGQVHSVPADSNDGGWATTQADRAFAEWYRARFGEDERWTAEHLSTGAPKVEDLRAMFPEAVISGIVNCDVWQLMMHAKYGRKGFLDRLGFAIRYRRDYRAMEQRPPYKNALLVIRY